jgi:RAB protein geranylgeranyltransferase component A
MTAPPGTFIQFSSSVNETTDDELFIKHSLKNIAEKNKDVREVFRRIADDVFLERHQRQRPLSINGLSEHEPIYLNQVEICTYRVYNCFF